MTPQIIALTNAGRDLNITIKVYLYEDKRKNIKYVAMLDNKISISPPLDYTNMNNFLLGYSRCMKFINNAINY